MSESASVRSFEALEEVRAAIADFRRRAGTALGEATSEMQRLQHWLEADRPMHWRGELRRRADRLHQARAELSRVLMGSGGESSAREQRALIAKAQAAAEEAQKKLTESARWAREMDRQSVLLRGGIAPLMQSIDAALPRAESEIVQLIARLEAYLKTSPAARPKTAPETEPTRDSESAP